jgi:hypothetical protein
MNNRITVFGEREHGEAIGIWGPFAEPNGGPVLAIVIGGARGFHLVGKGAETFADFAADDRGHGEDIGQGY